MQALQSLSQATLPEASWNAEITGETTGKPVRILQIGDGTFLRAFADWMIDVANGKGLLNARVTMAQSLPKGNAGKLAAQDHLYTVLTRGAQGGSDLESRRIVTCIDSALDPHRQWAEMQACVRDPALRFVISNTTEAGLTYQEERFFEARCPQSFPAKVAALLYARFQRFENTPGSGLVLLPCELTENNGGELKRIVLQHAQKWALPAGFISWVERENQFLNTLVDRIVPGFPTGEAADLFRRIGYRDSLLVTAEPYHLWVIEGPPALAKELPLREAGLSVVWTNDLAPYRTRKVRILNGVHSAAGLAAYSAGLGSVGDMMRREAFERYVKHVVFEEIVPFVPMPEQERRQYAELVLERLRNPHMHHELLAIAQSSVSKWRVRVLPSIKDFASKRGSVPAGLSFSLAALICFYRGSRDERGAYVGRRGKETYTIQDDAVVVSAMEQAWQAYEAEKQVAPMVTRLLADERLWNEGLNSIPGLAERVIDGILAIQRLGSEGAVLELLKFGH